jgi:hypothetical protein
MQTTHTPAPWLSEERTRYDGTGRPMARYAVIVAEDETYEDGQLELFQSTTLATHRSATWCEYDDADTIRANVRLAQAAPLLFDALRALVNADSCNYWRDTMRYCGYFDAGRAALNAASGQDFSHPNAGRTRDPLIWALLAIASAGDTVSAPELRQIARNALDEVPAPDNPTAPLLLSDALREALKTLRGHTPHLGTVSGCECEACDIERRMLAHITNLETTKPE